MDGWLDDGQGNEKRELVNRKKKMNEKLGLWFRYTRDIIEAAEKGMWTDKPFPWIRPGETLLRRMLSASQ